MDTSYKLFLTPPVLPNGNQTRTAKILHVILLSTMVINPFYCLVLLYALPDPTPPLIANACLLGIQMLAYVLLQRRRVFCAVLIDISGTWLFFSFMVFIFGGSRSPGVVGYFLIVLMAGLLLNSRAAYFFAGLSTLFSFFILYLETQGRLPPSLISLNPVYTWGTLLLGLVVVAILLQLTTDHLNHALQTARQSAKALAEKNKQLSEAHERLEQKISELKETEAALRRSEGRLQSVIQSAPVILWGTDVQGKMSFLQGKPLESLGFRKDQFVGNSILSVSGGRISSLESNIQQALKGDSSSSIERLRDRIFEIHYSPFREEKEIKGVIGVAVDITERHKAEEALLYTQKLESLGILAGGIAHDFNNLLSAILGQNSVAKMKLEDGHPASRHIEKAILSIEKATSLTKQMLAYSGRGRFTIGSVDLNELLQDNLHLLDTAVSKSVYFNIHLSQRPLIVEGDISQLQQVIMNLIINAAEAMENRSGTVTLETNVVTVAESECQDIGWTGNPLSPGHYAKVTISDTGKGMTPEVLQKIFDPFFTTKMTGRGLGLAAVQGIVRGHHGNLFVESQIDVGTSFQLFFPLSQVEQDENQAESVMDDDIVQSEMIILFIDDDPTIREAVTDIMDIYDIDLITAASGLEGIEKYKENKEKIDLILLDLTMPGLSGFETLKLIRQIDEDVPVILSSGYSEEAAIEGLAGMQADGFIKKPYKATDLIAGVREALQTEA